MNIKLNLNKHCIETEVKRLHNRAVSQYFKSNQDRKRIEECIELLHKALKELNWSELRSSHTELAGHNNDCVILSKEKNHLVICINGIKIDL